MLIFFSNAIGSIKVGAVSRLDNRRGLRELTWPKSLYEFSRNKRDFSVYLVFIR